CRGHAARSESDPERTSSRLATCVRLPFQRSGLDRYDASLLARRTFMLPSVSRRWLAAGLALGFCTAASADDVLFENVRIFDGKSTALSAPSNVLVKGNLIERISTAPIALAGALRIAGNGRTLMPGLIDNHWHAMLARTTPAQAFGDVGFNNLVAGD